MARAARYSSRVDIAVFTACVLFSLVALVLPAQMRDPAAEVMRRSVVAPLVVLQQGAERWRSAWLERERQQMKVDSLALRAFGAQAAERENAQLRKLLGLGGRLRWGFVPAEALHSSGRADVVTTLTITAGSDAGVKRYSPVVAADGIVGLVQTADPTLSIAILFSHPDFRASAMSSDGGAYGIVYPHLLGSAAERYLLELRGVPFRAALRPGATILTSGLGGTFPRGITIGTVVRELRTAEGWTRTYLIQPAVNPASVSAVMVLSADRVARGVGDAWASVAQVDSAARRIAAAGDSLGREAALAEAAARRAALDSVRRAAASPDTAAPERAPAVAPETRTPQRNVPEPEPEPVVTPPRRTIVPPPSLPPPTRIRDTSTGVRPLPVVTDSITRRTRPRPDTLRPDTLSAGVGRRDSARRSVVRVDSTARPDTLPPDTLTGNP